MSGGVSKIKSIFSYLYVIYRAVFLVHLFLFWWLWEISILHLFIIIESEIWITIHYLGLGHETMVSVVCLAMTLSVQIMVGRQSSTVLKYKTYPVMCISRTFRHELLCAWFLFLCSQYDVCVYIQTTLPSPGAKVRQFYMSNLPMGMKFSSFSRSAHAQTGFSYLRKQ